MTPQIKAAALAIARSIIDCKDAEHLRPLAATQLEIQEVFNANLVDAMRQLVKEGTFRGTKNVNGIPTLYID